MHQQQWPVNGPVELEIDIPDSRNRITVGFRVLLLIPQYFALFFIAVGVFVVLFLGWFAALFTGWVPKWARKFLVNYLGYTARVSAYQQLLVDRYPPFAFTAPDHPVQLDVPPAGRLNRAAVGFRYFLVIPVAFVGLGLTWGWFLFGFIMWLAILITGRTPTWGFEVSAATLRFNLRYNAYFSMLTSSYPKGLLGDHNPGATEQRSRTRPLVLSQRGRQLVVTMTVVGVVGYIGYQVFNNLYVQPMLQQVLMQQALHRH